MIDPELADRREGELLEAAERRALESSRLSMRKRGDGTTHGSFRLPDLHADMLRTALEALSSPRRHHPNPHPTRHGHADGATDAAADTSTDTSADASANGSGPDRAPDRT